MNPDAEACLVAVALENFLGAAGALLRQRYQETLLLLVKQGTAEAALAEALEPHLAEFQVQLAVYVAAVVVSLFDNEALANLPASLQPFRQLADERCVLRALLRQMNYLGEVGEHLHDSEYNVAWGLFHLRLYNKEVPRGFGLRLRSVTLYLPQPVAAAIKYPPLPNLPTLGEAHFPESAEAHPSFLLARWRHETTVSASSNFQQWYMNLATPGPHLAAVLAGSNLHYEVVQHCQIPPLRLTLTTRAPCAGAPLGTPQPNAASSASQLAAALTELGWTAEAVAQMPREVHHPSPSELLLSLHNDEPKPPRARPLLITITQVGPTFSYHFLEPKFGSTPRLAEYFSSASQLTFGARHPPKPSRLLTPKEPITYDQLGLLLREAVPNDPAS